MKEIFFWFNAVSYTHLQEVHTTLAFVHTFEDGDRDFAFYRNPGADMMLSVDQIDEEYIRSAKAFHFGTLSMTHEGVRRATAKAIDIAREAGLLISFDPNLRPPLWSSMELAREQITYGPVSYTHLGIMFPGEVFSISHCRQRR